MEFRKNPKFLSGDILESRILVPFRQVKKLPRQEAYCKDGQYK